MIRACITVEEPLASPLIAPTTHVIVQAAVYRAADQLRGRCNGVVGGLVQMGTGKGLMLAYRGKGIVPFRCFLYI